MAGGGLIYHRTPKTQLYYGRKLRRSIFQLDHCKSRLACRYVTLSAVLLTLGLTVLLAGSQEVKQPPITGEIMEQGLVFDYSEFRDLPENVSVVIEEKMRSKLEKMGLMPDTEAGNDEIDELDAMVDEVKQNTRENTGIQNRNEFEGKENKLGSYRLVVDERMAGSTIAKAGYPQNALKRHNQRKEIVGEELGRTKARTSYQQLQPQQQNGDHVPYAKSSSYFQAATKKTHERRTLKRLPRQKQQRSAERSRALDPPRPPEPAPQPPTASAPSLSTGGCLPVCPSRPTKLVGHQEVVLQSSEAECSALAASTGVRSGGSWAPSHCQARSTVAIIVPVRDREEQVWAFLSHMHRFLQRQELNYTIYIVQQTEGELFNRAKLLNVGFVHAASSLSPLDCVVFHDVDMLPEDDRHLYHCSLQPRHLVVASSNNKYRSSLSFQRSKYFGGACMMTPFHVRMVNGWSNKYWGWGGEDDDMWRRLAVHDLPVWRYPAVVARYTMLPHGPPPGINHNSYADLARLSPLHSQDGLNSLQYRLVAATRHRHHTRLLVDVGGKADDQTAEEQPKHSRQNVP